MINFIKCKFLFFAERNTNPAVSINEIYVVLALCPDEVLEQRNHIKKKLTKRNDAFL
jgi:hypothetical protein